MISESRDGDFKRTGTVNKSGSGELEVDRLTRVGDGCAKVCNPVP